MDTLSGFLTFERLVIVYAAAFVIIALTAASPAARPRATAAAVGLLLAVLVVATYGQAPLRLVAPHVYLLIGYWLPGLVVKGRRLNAFGLAFEGWLLRTDAVLRPRLPGLPPRIIWPMELAYLFCYPLVPLAFVLVWARGAPEDLERFWLLVLSAGYACYATLPWLLSRPPRVLQPAPPEPGGVRRLNALVLGQFSHHWNTFPSGHVAVSAAAAVGLWQVWPGAGLVIGALALAVGVGAAAGRYHYVVDVAAGAVVAAVAAVLPW